MNNSNNNKVTPTPRRPAAAPRKTQVPAAVAAAAAAARRKRPAAPPVAQKPVEPVETVPAPAEEKKLPVRPAREIDYMQCIHSGSLWLLDVIIRLHRQIGDAIVGAVKKCSVPFRMIPAGISYAVFFLLAAFTVWSVYWAGDGIYFMRNAGELLPALHRNSNEISFNSSNITMLYPELDPDQRGVFLKLRKAYKEVVAKERELEALSDQLAKDDTLEDEQRNELKKPLIAQIKAAREKMVMDAKPITGFDRDAFEAVGAVVVQPEILHVTIAIVNVNQGNVQNFNFRVYDPQMDIDAGIIPPAEKDLYLNLWKQQKETVKALCHVVRENVSFQASQEDALKRKDTADKAAVKITDEKKRGEITSKRVEDYFCDAVSKEDRAKLDIFIKALNKEIGSDESDNKPEKEKVYIYVNRVPPMISIGITAVKEMKLGTDLLTVLNYPVDEFRFSNDNFSNLQNSFALVNTKVLSPAEQRKRIRAFRERDAVGENLDRINANVQAETNRQNRLLAERIENEVQEIISQRVVDAKDKKAQQLTKEYEENIRQYVIRDKGYKPITPVFRERKSVSPEEKQRWIDESVAKEGFDPENMFYSPIVVDVVRENGLLRTADIYFSGVVTTLIVFFLVICALLALGGPVLQIVIEQKTSRSSGELDLTGLIRKQQQISCWAYYAVMAGLIGFAVYWFGLLWLLCDIPDQILAVITEKELFCAEEKTVIWLHYFCYWVPGCVIWAIAMAAFLRPGMKAQFMDAAPTAPKTTNVLFSKDGNSSFSRSFSWVVFYLLCLLLLPYLLNFAYIGFLPNPFAPMNEDFNRQDAYNIPGGGGDAAPAQQVVVKKKKKKKIKKYIINPRTSIIFEIPPLNDEEHLQEIDEATETQYTTGSMFGKGKNKGRPGWAGGMEDAPIRFIRLQYNGTRWDWNMGKGADYNMLIYLRDIGFKIANDTESVTINKLAKGFRKGKKPPFVYMTGQGTINLSASEVKQLNDYLLKDGGMIFADNAGGNFHHYFVAALKRILPNHKLVEIANDDPIFTAPYYFPNGAPALFRHSGSRALGIKNNGRWIVFYHQGDIGDAWKGAGLTEQQRTDAFKMGANVISYAFGAYLESLSK